MIAERVNNPPLAAAVYETVPGPEPAPEPIVTHDDVVVAFQAHSAVVVTSKEPLPPSGGKLAEYSLRV